MGRRLTDDQRRYRELTEAQFMRQVTDLAMKCGWHWIHVRPAAQMNRTKTMINRYTTPTTGTLGKGWPDLVLINARQHRLIFAELKREVGETSPEQDVVLDILRNALDWRRIGVAPSVDVAAVEVYVWRPSDIEHISLILG